jgi:hypothetical protein
LRLLRSQRFILGAVGISLSGALYLISVHAQSPLQDLLVGIATSFVFATLVDVLLVAQGVLLSRDRMRFFGAELVHKETTFVYPNFVLHDDVRLILSSYNQQLIFQRPLSRFTALTVHRIDVPSLVAVNDIQALLYVSSIFDSNMDSPNVMVVDSKILEDCDRSFISFGLSSNDCTHLYLHESSAPLFQVIEDGAGSEYIKLRSGQEYRSTDRRQYGVIVRHAPDLHEAPQRRWMLVAGLGPVGTTGAGWFLARHWQALSKRVPPECDFVAVISVGSYTDRMPRLQEVLIDGIGDGAT